MTYFAPLPMTLKKLHIFGIVATCLPMRARRKYYVKRENGPTPEGPVL